MFPVRQSLRISQNEALHEGGAAVAGGSRNKSANGFSLAFSSVSASSCSCAAGF